jgi:hypothetical protein
MYTHYIISTTFNVCIYIIHTLKEAINIRSFASGLMLILDSSLLYTEVVRTKKTEVSDPESYELRRFI